MDKTDIELLFIKKKYMKTLISHLRLLELNKKDVESAKVDELSDESFQQKSKLFKYVLSPEEVATLELRDNDYSDYFSQIISIWDKKISDIKEQIKELKEANDKVIKDKVRNTYIPVSYSNPGFMSSWRLPSTKKAPSTPSTSTQQKPSEFKLGGKRSRRQKSKKRKHFRKK